MAGHLEERVREIEENEAYQRGYKDGAYKIGYKFLSVCALVTGAILTSVYKLGMWLMDRYDAVEAGIKAFWQANGGGR